MFFFAVRRVGQNQIELPSAFRELRQHRDTSWHAPLPAQDQTRGAGIGRMNSACLCDFSMLHRPTLRRGSGNRGSMRRAGKKFPHARAAATRAPRLLKTLLDRGPAVGTHGQTLGVFKIRRARLPPVMRMAEF